MKSHKTYEVDLSAIAREAVARYGFAVGYSSSVIKEVKALKENFVMSDEKRGLRDRTDILWSSIDNVDSLDLDQLEYCERGPRGEIQVSVAVADVDLFVPRGSKTDHHAAACGNSVYTGIETFPMLPERLSTDLSSLREGVDRRAIVVEFAVLKNGSIRQGDVYPALVRNKAKLVYEQIGAWLDEKTPLPPNVAAVSGLEDQLRLQDEAARRLRDFRVQQGALELESLETRVVKENGTIAALVLPQDNPAQRLIENFMIAANRTVMDRLGKAGMLVIQRIVRIPKNWPGIRQLAAESHEFLPEEPDVKALSLFLLKRKKADPSSFADLSLTVIKLLGPGEYELLEPGKPPVGHFGLAVTDYTHATAPNRRYVDLIIQRLIKATIAGRACPYSRRELIEHAAWCTDRDKAAKKVERFMRKVGAAVLLEGKVGDEFEAIVTGASEKGVYARLMSPVVEGRVVRGGERMAVGQKVRVRLVDLDPRQGHIDLVKVREI